MTHPSQLASVLLVAAVLVIAACRGASPPAEQVAAETGVAIADAKAGTPKISADEAVYEFGEIGITDSIEHVFKIRNTGDAELKIERVQKT